MKYSVQQIEEALKGGKTIFFQGPYGVVTEYEANLCPNPDLVVVSWTEESGSYRDIVYKLTRFIDNFDNGWICTKIEGEETVEKKNTPHKHAELIKKWADGAIIQLKQINGEWADTTHNDPSWGNEFEYRVKPTLVKKWKWVLTNKSGEGTFFELTPSYYANEEDWVKAVGTSNPWKLHQKIDSTMIEVEE